MLNHSASPREMFASGWRNRSLIKALVVREILGRYQGSVFGLLWSFFNPVLLLAVYTFVFSVVFKARWGGPGDESQMHFAVILFVGILVHGLFAEVANRAPSLILSNPNYVKKVVFPLEILPVVALGSALFHLCISLLVLLATLLLLNGAVHWTALFFPLVLLPLVVFTLGIAWMLASLGVFLRDVNHVIGLITMLMMFLSPVFYPITAVPEIYRPWIYANPLTFILKASRDVLIRGQMPEWGGLFVYGVIASAVAWAGFAWFQKTRKGFADVL